MVAGKFAGRGFLVTDGLLIRFPVAFVERQQRIPLRAADRVARGSLAQKEHDEKHHEDQADKNGEEESVH